MGGRGASSGIGKNGKQYGTEYHTILQEGNIKFVEKNERVSETLMETMTRGRVYVTVGGNDLLSIMYFDNDNRRIKSIDMDHEHAKMKPHTHHGYYHKENDSKKGAAQLTLKEKWLKELKGYGMLIVAENSLGGQNALMDEASVQFRLTAKGIQKCIPFFIPFF